MTNSDQQATLYAFLCHGGATDVVWSGIWVSAEAQRKTEAQARAALQRWLEAEQAACDVQGCACTGGGNIVEDMTDFAREGMAQHMVTL